MPRWTRRAVLGAALWPLWARALPKGRSASSGGPPDLHSRSESALGTLVEISVPAQDGVDVEAALEDAFAEIQRLHRMLSSQNAGGDIARINAAAGSHSVVVSEETFVLVRRCAEFSEFSHGVFDITYAAMNRLWTFDRDAKPRLPDPDEVSRLRKLIDYRRIILEEERRSIMLPGAQMRLGLGGIARGYALDRAAQALVGRGVTSLRATAGGLRLALGRYPQGSWRVGLPDPRAPEKVFASVDVQEGAAATLGDYERFVVVRNKRYHPIIDPRTGYPARTSRAVTVLAPRAVDADWLSKACFILGPKEAAPVLANVAGAQALWVTRANGVEMTDGMKKRTEMLAPPTDGDP